MQNLECVKYILDNFNHILNINAQDFNGNTCLHWAAQNGNKSMVELLLDRGINKNIRNYDAKHNTAFWSAKKGKHAAIIFGTIPRLLPVHHAPRPLGRIEPGVVQFVGKLHRSVGRTVGDATRR